MKEKIELLLAMELLEYEIRQLLRYTEQSCASYELLRDRLDHLSSFIRRSEMIEKWEAWGNDADIRSRCDQLRETASAALAAMEKHQSSCIAEHNRDMGSYFTALTTAVDADMKRFEVSPKSKVMFIGSGALPLSALTIARATGAHVTCLDIDSEALELADRLAAAAGLASQVTFTGIRASEHPSIGNMTHIIIASLVPNKLEVLNELYDTIQSDTKVILRYGNGLKAAFNYPFEPQWAPQWQQKFFPSDASIYDTILLQKLPLPLGAASSATSISLGGPPQ